ncbi:MAG: STAS domain-containing protein [Candidatus Zixiibacteriota bacterium]
MKVKDYLDGDVVTIELSGRILPCDELTSFHGRIHYYLNLNKKRYVIDLKGVDWMSSAGLGALITAYTSVTKAEGKLILTNITNIQNLLNITQLVRVFEIRDSKPEAMEAVKR